jgi:hypothetical protein
VELFCTLLTGFFLWLFVYQWRRKSIARMDRLAGSLLCRARSFRTGRSRRVLFIWFSLALLWNVFGIVFGERLGIHVTVDLGSQCGLAVMFAVVLMLGIPARRNTALEVRKNGVLCGKWGDRVAMGGLYFVPWNQIAACQWVAKSFGAISRFDDTHSTLTIAQDAILPERQRSVTAAVGQFVPIYDYDGTLLAEPDREQRKARWIPWRDLDRPPLQFDLQTMLLLVVVVACFAGLVSIRYRSPEFQAVMKLKAFSPRIEYWGQDHVHQLDFSVSPNKPTDADLVYLEPLSELVLLDLSGAPITDAGLKHLKGLKKLSIVELANTGVTEAGMEDLRRALPKASIAKRVHWIPPGLVPLAPTPAKGKRRH